MKKIKLLLEAMRLKKTLGKSFTKTNKRDLTTEELEKQVSIGSIINDIKNVFTLKFIAPYIIITTFLLCTIIIFLPENEILICICIILGLCLILIPMIFIGILINGFETSKKQLTVNRLIELSKKDVLHEKVIVIESEDIIKKFANYYEIYDNTDLVIIDNTKTNITIYSCTKDGYILQYRIDDITQTLIHYKKVTLDEFVEVIMALCQ